MQSRQFHSRGLVNGQSSIFARELIKYSENLKDFTGRVPCNNWTLGLQRKWFTIYGKLRNFWNWWRRKPRHSVQNVFACASKHYSQYCERMEKQSFGILTGRIHSWAQKLMVFQKLWCSFYVADFFFSLTVYSAGFGVAISFLTVKLKIKSHIITYLLASLARPVRRKLRQDLSLKFSPYIPRARLIRTA